MSIKCVLRGAPGAPARGVAGSEGRPSGAAARGEQGTRTGAGTDVRGASPSRDDSTRTTFRAGLGLAASVGAQSGPRSDAAWDVRQEGRPPCESRQPARGGAAVPAGRAPRPGDTHAEGWPPARPRAVTLSVQALPLPQLAPVDRGTRGAARPGSGCGGAWGRGRRVSARPPCSSAGERHVPRGFSHLGERS